MGLSAVAAAARARPAIDTLAEAPETDPELIALTREAGMRGWEGELARRAAGSSLDEAVAALRWWPQDLVRHALTSARARPGYDAFLDGWARIEARVAVALLGGFPFLEGLVADLEWLAERSHPGESPQLAMAVRHVLPSTAAPRAVALSRALSRFRDDCEMRAWARLGYEASQALAHLVPDPAPYGWDRGASREAIPANQVEAARREADILAADPWDTMTESRRTRALGVVLAAADHVGALPL